MKSPMIAAALLGLSSAAVMADDSLPAKAADTPAVTGAGSTDMPTAKEKDGSLSDKAMKDTPGVTGTGPTTTPTAEPADGSLSDKAKKDAPATAPTTTE